MLPVNNYSDFRYENKYSSYLPSIAIVFYMILLTSSVAGQKLISIFGIVISAGNITFQISYMLIACIAELYGMDQAKKIIITGAFCNLFVSYFLYFVVKIPGASFWTDQDNFSKITLVTSSILFTSTIAYVSSEIANAKIVTKLQKFFQSKFFIVRAIFSTSVASIVDTTFMLPVIIAHSSGKVIVIYSSLILMKTLYSIISIPIFWLLVEYLRKKEPFLKDDVYVPFSSVLYMKNKPAPELRATD